MKALVYTDSFRLSLRKGEGRVRVRYFLGNGGRTPHLNPLPLIRGEAVHPQIR